MRYKTVDDYIDSQNEEYIELILPVRNFICCKFPELEERISYNVPFYYLNGPLCYISPNKEGIYLGFTNGFKINEFPYDLVAEGRKQIKIFKIPFNHSINFDILEEIMRFAIQLKKQE